MWSCTGLSKAMSQSYQLLTKIQGKALGFDQTIMLVGIVKHSKLTDGERQSVQQSVWADEVGPAYLLNKGREEQEGQGISCFYFSNVLGTSSI